MFEALSDRFENIFRRLRGKGRLTEADVDEILREIRTALLEADVNVGVARDVVARIREQAIGATRSQALDPSQQVVKIVNGELTRILGGEALKITYASRPPTVVLMAGLQGSGKTTNAAKLARWFKAQGRQPLMVGADLTRTLADEPLGHRYLLPDVCLSDEGRFLDGVTVDQLPRVVEVVATDGISLRNALTHH